MIENNIKQILNELPEGVILVAAAKTRTPEEVLRAAEAGIRHVGENYVQEALEAFKLAGRKVTWHFIGHLQKNKAGKAVELFDMVQTVDSFRLAGEIDKRCARISKVMPVLIEVNSAREKQKFGVFPENTVELVKEISVFRNIRVSGLMTMGPGFGSPEDLRPYFALTREIFEQIRKLKLPGVEMRYLSMGMTGSYKIAVEEGANMVRIGSKIFGERDKKTRE